MSAPEAELTAEQRAGIIDQCRRWVSSFVVELNICPFARREVEAGRVRYQVVDGSLEEALLHLVQECQLLDAESGIETTLLVYPRLFNDFDDYLDLVEMANELLCQQGYEGIYQLATFHPDYCFDGVPPEDASNYTNRSPYPMLHLIREASLEKALEFVDNPDQIPERNIALMNEMGIGRLKEILAYCKD